MKLINISPTEDPSKIAHIDMNNTIIMCVNENNKVVEFIENSIYLKTPTDISLHNQRTLVNNYAIINYSPNIKWCIPSYINITFQEPISFRDKCYFSNVYTNTTFQLNLIKIFWQTTLLIFMLIAQDLKELANLRNTNIC